MNRNNFSQLPSSRELEKILEQEQHRKIPKDKEGVHFFEFTTLINLATHFGINADILSLENTLEKSSTKELLSKGQVFINELKDAILKSRLDPESVKHLDNVYEYLSKEDSLKNADIIFVFGAKTPLRIEKAIELYKKNVSKRILISGKGPHYKDNPDITEAKIYAKKAIEAGVPQDSLILENNSITIPDNVRSSLNLIEKQKINHDSIILVNSPYTQRRGWAHFKKYTNDSVALIRVNSKTGELYQKDSWYKNPQGIDVILGEFIKAKVAVSLNTA